MSAFTRLPSSALRLTGDDRLDFVQGQMTNNLKAAPTPGMVPACFLSARGQIEFFARIYRREDDIYLHLAEGEAAALKARFRKYIIFDAVEVHDLSDQLATLHLWNESLPGWNAEGGDVQSFELGGGAVLVGRVNRTGTPGLDVHYLRQHEETLLAALKADERSFEALEAARIRAGISDVTQDRWAGFLPQEVGLESAVSYRKGCYVGQEIMARLEARGNARYHLAQLTGEQLPAYNDVTLEGRVVGRSGKSAGDVTLSRLRKDVPQDAVLDIGGAKARLGASHPLPVP